MSTVADIVPSGGEEDSFVDSEWEDTILSSVSSKSSTVMFVCPHEGCSKYFSKRGRLNTHLLCHTGQRPFKCSECESSYTRQSHLQRHVQNVHLKLRFQCEKCPSHFFAREALKKHDRLAHGSSLGSARFRCDDCGKTFHKRNHLTSHRATHEGQLPHKCNICQRGFTFPNKLRRHMLLKHGGKKCDDCGKEVATYFELRKHRAEEHPIVYKCDQCDFVTKAKGNYNEHAKTHGDEREIFHCPEEGCQQSFVRSTFLTQHLRVVHKGQRFVCTYCDKGFTSKQRQKIHEAAHEKEAQKSSRASSPPKPKKPREKRRDKGALKKAMATILSNVASVDEDGEKMLLQDRIFPIEAESIAREIAEQPDLVNDFLLPDNSEAAGQICQKEFCNEKRSGAAKTRGVLKSVKVVKCLKETAAKKRLQNA